MGKNKRGKGRGQPQRGMRHAAPAALPTPEPWPRPPHGGFRGLAPARPMGPPGQRFRMPPPQHSRVMMRDDMGDDRRFMHEQSMVNEPLHPLDFHDRPGFRPSPFDDRADLHFHTEFDDRPPLQRFYPPEYECGPRYHHPDFVDGPPDFYPPEFRGRPPNLHPSDFEGGPAGVYPPEFHDRPGFHMMNPEFEPMECYRPRDPNYMPQMDAHGHPAFGERGGFAGPPQDFRGPVPPPPPPPQPPPQPQIFNAATVPPTKKTCPPQPQKIKEPPKSTETKSEPSKISTLKNITANPPRGRSLGVISFIGNNCGFIERDDLKKFSFAFNAYFGNRAHLVPGVKVHFTAVKNTLGKELATDVKVAPGGTEELDGTVYEGVVTTALPDDNGKEPNPGRIRTIISVDPIKLPFGKEDTSVTLLLYDRVEFQLITNVITKEQRATNIKPKMPETFKLTKEIREMGVVMDKSEGTLTIKTEKHDILTASAADILSEDELNVKNEVEFTLLTVNDTKKAVRLKKLCEGSVTFNQAKGNEHISDIKENTAATSPVKDKWKPVTSGAGSQESVVSYNISSEKYEGTIVKVAPKNSQTQEKETDKQEPALGLLVTAVEGKEKKLSFRSGDVITKATMMPGDKVQFNISTNSVTAEESAVNLQILPDTFQTESEEQRKIGLIAKLDDKSGFIKTQQDPQIFFDMSEVMEETKLTLSEKVEFTLVPNEAAAGGNQAVRIRRLYESFFTSAPKLEALGVKEKQKKMTIKLLKDPKDKIKEDVNTEDKGKESKAVVKPNTGKDKTAPSLTLMGELKKERDIKQDKTKTKDDRARSRSRENSRRRYSRSRSRESDRRRYSRSRSRSRDRSSRRYRSSSRERRDGRYRRSRSRELPKGYRRSNSRSRSRERSSRTSRRNRTPENRDDRYKKQSGSKESSNRKRAKSPDDNVDEELSKKRKELMELNELIARKKAIVAMEQNAKKFEIEVDGPHGVKTFDYQHVHCENLWMPELKPVKSILKKQSELHAEQHFQASTSKETAPSIQSASFAFACLDSQKASAFDSNTPVYSTLEGDSEKSLTTARPEKIPLPQIEDPELLRKKKQLDELSESIARKRAIIALEQKTKSVQDTPGIKRAFEFDSFSDDQFFTSKENLWSADLKSNVQPKKSILKKRSELLCSQSDTTSVEDYGQAKPSREDSALTKPSFQLTAASLFDTSSNRQPFHSDTSGLFNKIINESSATLQITDSSPFNKPIVAPKALTQASKPQSLHDQKPSSVSKGNRSPEDQPRVISSHKHERSQSSSPSTSQASPSDQKRNVTTQMERFLSALNRADSSIVNSLFQEARKDLALISKPKPPQPQLDRNIPFMDEIYDPFKEDEDKDEPSVMRKDVGRHSFRKLSESQVETETHLEDPIQDDLLPHERAVQDGSGFSRLVGTKCGIQPTAKAKKNIPYDPQMASDNWNTHKANPNWFSEQWNSFKEDKNTAEQKDYADDLNPYREHSRSAEYQNVSPNVQRSYKKDREIPDSKFDKSLARQQSEESNEDKDEKKDQFEKIQNLLQTIGFHLDTGEVNKLADRTRERLYGKAVKPASFHSLDRNREPSMSRSEHGGSSRADSSDTEGIRSVSPAQSSNRKVYMSYKDSVTYRDQHKAEDVDLTSIKRTVLNLKSEEDTQDPCTPSSEETTVSPVLYQPTPAHVLSTAEPASSHYAQNPAISTYSASQYSYYSNEQNPWSSAYSLDSSQNASLQYSAYPFGTVPPPPPTLGYASYHQPVPPHMMPSYSSYTTQMANPYSVGSPLLPNPFVVPPVANPLLCSTETKKTQPVRCLKTIETVQLAAGPARSLVTIEPIERRQTRSMQRDAENKQVATITEDDIKAKQKKRLEQFNQRMKLKKEQQMEAQRSRGQKQNSTPGKSTPNEIKNVWICGHSLVFWAEKRATSPEFGVQLGMHPNSVRIWWKGVQGMTWQQLLPLLLQLKDNWPRPDVLIVHLGGNDISTTAPETFIETVKKDLTSLKSIFPECLVVWSDILSRRSWRDREDSKEMDIIRMAINDNIHQIMSKLGGSALTHDNIRPSLGLYRPDGVHLSGKGIDTFNLNLQDFLEKWESETETKTESSDPSVQDANS